MLRVKKSATLFWVLLFVSFLYISQLLLTVDYRGDINIITNLPREPLHNLLECLEISVYNVTSNLCLKTNDSVISTFIQEYGAWEEDKVTDVMRAMEMYQDAVFIDGGCNIGMFTVMVAAMKGERRMVAVDILQQNIDFVKTSLSLSRINSTGRVEFVLNAISDKYETLYPIMEVEGNGGSSKAVKERVSSEWRAVRSVTLPDVLSVIPAPTYILKIDIQGYDCQVLGQENLYSGPYFIPFIFMEYDSDSSHCPSAVDVLMSQGYSAFLTTKLNLRGVKSYIEIDKNCFSALGRFKNIHDITWAHSTANRSFIEVGSVGCTYIESQNCVMFFVDPSPQCIVY